MINENDVEILLANLSTGTETEFANMLYSFMQSGLVDKDRFRDIIIGARAKAYDDGSQDEKAACVRICKEMSEKIARRGGSVHPDNIAWSIRNR